MSPSRSQRGVEWLCVRECLRFSRRHLRYFLIVLMLYWHSLWHWKQARAARYGFCFLQLYDDIMDGDRVTDAPPDVIAAQTIAEWESGLVHGDTALSRLGATPHAALPTLPLLPTNKPWPPGWSDCQRQLYLHTAASPFLAFQQSSCSAFRGSA